MAPGLISQSGGFGVLWRDSTELRDTSYVALGTSYRRSGGYTQRAAWVVGLAFIASITATTGADATADDVWADLKPDLYGERPIAEYHS